MAKKETVLVICAHNDDQIIGAGGTMVKYKQEGKTVKTVVFSYGERSHPHMKASWVRKKRAGEASASDRILGCDGIIFLDLPEGKFLSPENRRAKKQLAGIIKKERPSRIFTHNCDDPHPDHRAALKVVLDVVRGIHFRGHVYSFNIWNFLNIRKRDSPKLVIDISRTFQKKIEAFLAHRSQQGTILTLLWSVYFQAMVNGLQHNTKYAEVFYRIQ